MQDGELQAVTGRIQNGGSQTGSRITLERLWKQRHSNGYPYIFDHARLVLGLVECSLPDIGRLPIKRWRT
jgi:hypothetical protein